MANKRVTRREKPSENIHHRQERKLSSSMEGTAEKLESLKSLNFLLLKEIVEHRQQVENLLKCLAALETKVSITTEEKRHLEDELSRLKSDLSDMNEKYASLDVERSLTDVFLASQFNEETQRLTSVILKEKEEMRTHTEQRDADFSKYKKTVENELSDLRLSMKSLEKDNAGLRIENVELVREKRDMERRQEVLEREILDLVRQKDEIEKAAVKKDSEILQDLTSIKSAFESREHKVAEMERQVECMKNSVKEANKKKTFWALFSSATAIFAAASVAYFRLGQ